MVSYESMSDFEINKRVGFMSGRIRKGKTDKHYEKFCPDYCNNPSGAWPIIVDNEITVGFSIGTPYAKHAYFHHYHKNPLRAAMIVYLMMKESELC